MLAIILLIVMFLFVVFFIVKNINDQSVVSSPSQEARSNCDKLIEQEKEYNKKFIDVKRKYDEMPGNTYALRVQRDNFERDVVIPAAKEWKTLERTRIMKEKNIEALEYEEEKYRSDREKGIVYGILIALGIVAALGTIEKNNR